MVINRWHILKARDRLNSHIDNHGCQDLGCAERRTLWLGLLDVTDAWGTITDDEKYELTAA